MKFSIEGFKAGDYIVITVPRELRHENIIWPGFKEAGLLGGVIVPEGINIETWSDDDLAMVGLMRIDPGPEPVCTCPPTGPIGVCMFCKSDTEKLIKDIAHEDY